MIRYHNHLTLSYLCQMNELKSSFLKDILPLPNIISPCFDSDGLSHTNLYNKYGIAHFVFEGAASHKIHKMMYP